MEYDDPISRRRGKVILLTHKSDRKLLYKQFAYKKSVAFLNSCSVNNFCNKQHAKSLLIVLQKSAKSSWKTYSHVLSLELISMIL